MPTTTVTRNVIANIAGAGMAGVAGLVVAPLFIRWLGVESYGLIGFQLTLQSVLALFDLGLSVAVTRELAFLSATPTGSREIRTVMRTSLLLYWTGAAIIAAAIAAGASLLASRWLASEALPQAVIVEALRYMGVAIAAQFLTMLYASGFLGMQRHVAYNVLVAAGIVLRLGGGAAVAYFTRDVRLFFLWQAAAGVLQVLLLAVCLNRVLPGTRAEARVDLTLLRGAWKLARGIAIISVLATIVVQGDKLAVSATLPLEVFGYYTVATLLAVTATGGAGPIGTAVFPRFAQLLGINDTTELGLAYHRAVQVAAVLVLPAACLIAVFSRQVLFVWTGSRDVAAAVWPVAAVLAAGAAMNGLLNVPYMLQLAHGRTMPAIVVNVVALITVVPAMVFATKTFGVIGPAVLFALMNAAFLCVGVNVTQRWLLPAAARGSFLRDVAPPLLAAAAIMGVTRMLMPETLDRFTLVAVLALSGIAAQIAAAAAAPAAREWALDRIKERRA